MRIGIGYDAHPLVPGRRLVLGGVEIVYGKGLAGHSDADVLIHAICDALLGAAGEGDLGSHFPDDDPAYEGVSSMVLLRGVVSVLRERYLSIRHIDAVVIAEEPRLAPYLHAMREAIASALGAEVDRVGLKATTTEGMGFTGRGEGIAALATCLLEPAET